MAWDESKHPRVPAGSSEGGQFAGSLTKANPIEQAFAKAAALLKEAGGFTINPLSADIPKEGFVVSVFESESRSFPLDRVSLGDFVGYVMERQALWADRGNYLGGWVHEGKVFLDVSRVVRSAREARELAEKHDQIAYWDIGNKREVIVNRLAKSGGVA